MSVQVNTYVIVGFKFDYDEFKELFDNEEELDKFHDEFRDSAFEGIKNKNGLTLISDSMSGEYAILGRVIAKTANHEHFQKPIELSDLSKIKEMTASLISLALRGKVEASNDDLEAYVVSHYR